MRHMRAASQPMSDPQTRVVTLDDPVEHLFLDTPSASVVRRQRFVAQSSKSLTDWSCRWKKTSTWVICRSYNLFVCFEQH